MSYEKMFYGILISSITLSFFLPSCKKSPKKFDDSKWENALKVAETFELKDYPKAILYLDSAYYSIENPGKLTQYQRFNFLRKCHHRQKLYSKAVTLCDSAINVLPKNAANAVFLAEVLLEKGDMLLLLKRYSEAYKSYYNGLSVIEALNTFNAKKLKSSFYSRLADISYGQNKYVNAINWHKKTLNTILKFSDKDSSYYRLQGTFNNIGLCYLFLNKPDSALAYFKGAVHWNNIGYLKKKLNRKDYIIAKGVIAGNIGSVQFRNGKVDSAEYYFKESIRLNRIPGYAVEDALITERKLADLYLSKRNFKNTAALIKDIQSSGVKLSNATDRLDFLKLKIRFAQAQKRFTDVSSLYRSYESLKDSIFNSKRLYLSTNFETEFARLANINELRSVEKEDLIKTIALIATLGLLIICLILIVNNNKIRRAIQISQNEMAIRNKKLETTLHSLEASFTENSKLLGIVAHDLKNPLNAIFGLSNLLSESQHLSDDDAEMVGLIMSSSKTMTAIVNDLLSSKKQQNSDEGHNTTNHIKDIVLESISLLRNRAKEKQIDLLFTVAEDCTVKIQRQQIWRVINNLLVNAIKFSPNGSQIYIATEIGDGSVKISVKDNGIGIPNDLKSKIFALSGEAKREGTQGEETYGMGLFISKQIIEDHGGHIWFDSLENIGTTFYITLPCSG
ncbi:tetratricopeptide repeat-containing sensor histidine kinase [Mucilaginibacter ginkgonis]|uniref:histidine kinase n=1 Tax=Mucilaginibacter ginkgonis TaxID=2682091 RepID=A0A6I4HW26_9SPHI|nr:ATP-binding protein [Mucilaginibacter ginkgonis]QQL50218.1 hypothetical protein GO620_001835 [Mucilaginibacter ginkgonis]